MTPRVCPSVLSALGSVPEVRVLASLPPSVDLLLLPGAASSLLSGTPREDGAVLLEGIDLCFPGKRPTCHRPPFFVSLIQSLTPPPLNSPLKREKVLQSVENLNSKSVKYPTCLRFPPPCRVFSLFSTFWGDHGNGHIKRWGGREGQRLRDVGGGPACAQVTFSPSLTRQQ